MLKNDYYEEIEVYCIKQNNMQWAIGIPVYFATEEGANEFYKNSNYCDKATPWPMKVYKGQMVRWQDYFLDFNDFLECYDNYINDKADLTTIPRAVPWGW